MIAVLRRLFYRPDEIVVARGGRRMHGRSQIREVVRGSGRGGGPSRAGLRHGTGLGPALPGLVHEDGPRRRDPRRADEVARRRAGAPHALGVANARSAHRVRRYP
eukprot:8411769-Pyramimonas_sp.AAC.1